MTTLNFDPMLPLKDQAYLKMMTYFNNLAALSAHSDMAIMLNIAKGAKIIHPIEARDATLQATAKAILAATTPDDLTKAMAAMTDNAMNGLVKEPVTP